MITSTRTIPALCPQCTTKIPDMVIKTETIYINCKCGCKKEIPIHEYITQLTQNKDRLYKYVYLCSPHMKPYTYYCSYCNRHLCDDCYKIHIMHIHQRCVQTVRSSKYERSRGPFGLSFFFEK